MYRSSLFCFLAILIFTSCSVNTEKKVVTIQLEHFVQDAFAPMFKAKFLEERKVDVVENPNTTYLISPDSDSFSTIPVVAKGGDYSVKGNQFRVIVVDMNNNGVFNEQEIDYVCIGAFEKDTATLRGHMKSLVMKDLIFQAGDEWFAISNIAKDGKSVDVEKLEIEDKPEASIVFPSKLLSLEAKLLSEQTIHVDSQIKDRFTLFEFWYSGCSGCITAIPKINALAEKYADDLLIIGVNSYDDLDYAQKLTEKHGYLGFNQQILGVESPAIMDYFGNVSMHPRAYLFDREGRLIGENITPMNLESVLEDALADKS